MNAGSPLVLAAGGLPDEVLLRMTGHLSRRPRLNEVARYVPPIPPAIFLQAQEKQPITVRQGPIGPVLAV